MSSPIITGTQARSLIEGAQAQIVDVRTADEFNRGAVPGARNIPLSILPLQATQLDRNRPVVVYCLSGGRSAQARMILLGMGFDSVHNLGSLQHYMNT